MNMVEKVARALCKHSGDAPDAMVGWTGKDEPSWKMWIVEARIAIAAMREPSDAMLDKGPGEPYMDRDVWARMIDAALAEGGGE